MSRRVCWATPRSIIEEVLAGDVAGATARDQDSARREQLDGQPVQPMVRPQGLVHRAAAAGELGRIEHHGVEPLARRQQRLEGLEAVADLEADVGQTVAGGVGLGQGDGLGAGIDAQRLAGAAQGRRRPG